ncbi:hypothetical protein SS50377_25262 [Spironucleus salmonicida]|uniref:Uncharacterized protein n=1 Tax=Spironucleus salmonicida TaxID=348837 RepID=V6LBP7_9EUKA|nr:hypothetical protein SS50377_25262 [Spironucleus salmonicida]|eukprot:EST41857.1 Hypothetical protein SS50377_18692 [Spironucleus salmonicida]
MSVEKLLKTQQELTDQIQHTKSQIKNFDEKISALKLEQLTSTANLEGFQQQLVEAKISEEQLNQQLQQITQEVNHQKERIESQKKYAENKVVQQQYLEEKSVQDKLETQILELIEQKQARMD